MKTFQGNIKFLNYLIYEIRKKFRKNVDNVKQNFMKIMNFKNIMRKNLENLRYLFSKKNTKIILKIEHYIL